MYYNKSLFLDFVLYVYENNLIPEGRIKEKIYSKLTGNINFFWQLRFSVVISFSLFYRKNRDILFYLNAIKPLILRNV